MPTIQASEWLNSWPAVRSNGDARTSGRACTNCQREIPGFEATTRSTLTTGWPSGVHSPQQCLRAPRVGRTRRSRRHHLPGRPGLPTRGLISAEAADGGPTHFTAGADGKLATEMGPRQEGGTREQICTHQAASCQTEFRFSISHRNSRTSSRFEIKSLKSWFFTRFQRILWRGIMRNFLVIHRFFKQLTKRHKVV